MNLYERNLRYLKYNNKLLYNSILKDESKYSSKVEVVEDKLNLLVENNGKKCFIHSLYDENREISEMFRNIESDVENLVLFGFGCGIGKEYIANNFKKLKTVIIIEPDLNLFKEELHYMDIEDLVGKLNIVTFVVNFREDQVINIIGKKVFENVYEKFNIVYNISYRTLYEGYYEKIYKGLNNFLKNVILNLGTNEHFLYDWTKNSINNRKMMALSFNSFCNKFSNIPAILVSAGASLDRNIEDLKLLKDKVIIAAAGSAIKILDSNGIIPHFRFAIDGTEEEKEIFQNINTEASPLFFSDRLYDGILPEYKGKKVRMILSTDTMSNYFQSRIESNFETIISAFSISNTALDALVKLGCRKIILLGQDFCYKDNQYYANGSWSKLNGMETVGVFHSNKTKNILGEDVYTTIPLLGFKNVMEEYIKECTDVSFINSSSGLLIEGAKNKKFRDVIKEDLTNDFPIDNIINSIYEEFDEEKNLQELIKLMLNAEEQVENLTQINEDRKKRLKKFHKYKEKKLGINRLINELEYIKSYENKLEEKSFYKEYIKSELLKTKFSAIAIKYSYVGKDKVKKIDCEENILLGYTVELEKYLEFLNKLLVNNIKELKSKLII
ncbi:motility associated factor glycosyltransferase family protein [Clostridium drakei]|uniref:6-hydroxymethylpterin diphosphokinase MptE-like domain-containing protein n=1 Tax=Clostridium drakei TaxID=332101 RepID=A0A2U8DM81_9CLOT|nr:6-hydroxymethylpterin diphosphokinase MptE-like protein [Clostridium drakei]AWI03678.1 hypothetical protein B9W14_04000 [Clostridium drakei]